jgi:hypothetical protein
LRPPARLADRLRPCDPDRGPTGRPTAAARPRPWPDWPTDRDRATKTVARLADRPRPCDQGRGPTDRPTATVRPRPWPDWQTDRCRATRAVARLADRPRPCDQDRCPTGRPTAAVRPRPWPDWPTDRIRVTARSPVTRWVSGSSVLVPRRACVRQYPRGGAGSRADGKSASVPRRAALVYLVPAALGCRRCGRHPLAGRESVRVSTPWRVGAYLVWWPRLHSCPPRETLRRAELRADA